MTYVYFCPIHKEFELEHKITESVSHCPKCKEDGLEPQELKRLIVSEGGFILNGSGWAKDNYS